MSFSSNAKHNIAVSAMVRYFSKKTNILEASTLLAQSIIEQEIGFSSEDISDELFNELIGEIIEPIMTNFEELSYQLTN